MDTLESHKSLSKCLKKEKCFGGVFPKDKIKGCRRNKCGFIINIDSSSEEGEHWVALFINNKKGEYFDSFGLPPFEKEIKIFIFRNCKKGCVYSSKQLQSFESQTCGVYAMLFVLWGCKGKKFGAFLNLFSRNSNINDIATNVILKMIKRKI